MALTEIEQIEQKIQWHRDQIDGFRDAIAKSTGEIRDAQRQIRSIRNGEEAKKIELFWAELGAEFDMTNHPKFEKLKEKAWERGHSSGFEEIRNCFIDLLDMVDR